MPQLDQPDTLPPWLADLEIMATFGLGDCLEWTDELEWAQFMIWLGYRSRVGLTRSHREFFFLLAPDRGYCSALTALGALLAARSSGVDELTWGEFLALPCGTPVFFKLRDRGKSDSAEGKIVGDRESIQGRWIRRVEVQLPARDEGTTLLVVETAFRQGKYGFSLLPYPKAQKSRKLGRVRSFFQHVGQKDETWYQTPSPEVLLVGSVAEFRLELEALLLSYRAPKGEVKRLAVTDVLMWSTELGAGFSHTQVLPIGSEHIPAIRSPLAILVGSKAFRAWEKVSSRRVLVLLNREEYDKGQSELLMRIAAVTDHKIRLELPAPLPPGVELSYFALPMGDV